MKITLKLLVTFEKYLPKGSSNSKSIIEIPDLSTVKDVLTIYNVPIDEAVILINGRSSNVETKLKEGDVLCAFPTAVGG